MINFIIIIKFYNLTNLKLFRSCWITFFHSRKAGHPLKCLGGFNNWTLRISKSFEGFKVCKLCKICKLFMIRSKTKTQKKNQTKNWKVLKPLFADYVKKIILHFCLNFCFITSHDISWHLMTSHDISWHLITSHNISWHLMTSHDIS